MEVPFDAHKVTTFRFIIKILHTVHTVIVRRLPPAQQHFVVVVPLMKDP